MTRPAPDKGSVTDHASVVEDPFATGSTYSERMRDAESRGSAGSSGTKDTLGATEEKTAAEKPKSFWAKASERPWVAHLIKAGGRFVDRLGTEFGAAITYFSFLAVVPIMMVAFSIVAFVLNGNPGVIGDLKAKANAQVPGGLLSSAIDHAVASRVSVGLIGLVVALYSGISWMANVRDAVQAQWRPTFEKTKVEKDQKFIALLGKNLLTMVGLGVALVISLVLTTVGGAGRRAILRLFGLDNIGWLVPVFSVVPFLLAMAADVLIFTWFYWMMRIPAFTPPKGAVLKGSVISAVGFEVLKVAMTFLIPKLSSSPTSAVFGTVIVLLFFFNLVAQLVLFVAAWIGTARRTDTEVDGELPEIAGGPTAPIQPGVGSPRTAGLVGVGAVMGFLAGRRRRRR